MAHRGELGDNVGTAFTVRPKQWSDGVVLILVLGIGTTVVAGIILLAAETRSELAVLALGTGLALTLAGVIAAVWRRRLAWQITAFEKGLEIAGPGGPAAIAFSEIAALGLKSRDEFSNGSYAGVTRRLQLWRQQDPVKRPCVDFLVFCKEGKPEGRHLAEVIDRLVNEVESRIEQIVSGGGTAKGVGLQLSQAALRIGSDTIPLERITAAGMHGGRLCLWLDAEAEPRHRLDPSLPNVLPICQLVQKRLDARGAEAEGDVAGLGRILFERRSSKFWAIVLMVVGVATIWLGVGFLLILWGVHVMVFRFRCHERGVYRRGLFSRREIRYRDLESFTFSATRQYYNGAYVGTAIAMKFVPQAGEGAKPISLSRSVRNADRDLDELREHVSRVVAARLLTALAQGTEIAWGANARLTAQALRYRPTKFIGKGDWTDLAYANVAGTGMKDGVLAVFAAGNDKPVLSLPVSTPNFFPCYHAFCHLAAKAKPPAA